MVVAIHENATHRYVYVYCTPKYRAAAAPWPDWAFRTILIVAYPAGAAVHHVGTVQRGAFDQSAEKRCRAHTQRRTTSLRGRPYTSINVKPKRATSWRTDTGILVIVIVVARKAFLHQSNPVQQWTLEMAWTRLSPLTGIVRTVGVLQSGKP